MTTAAIFLACRDKVSANAWASPKGSVIVSGTSGRNGPWYSSLGVMAKAPSVLP